MLFIGHLELTRAVAWDPNLDPGKPCLQLLNDGSG